MTTSTASRCTRSTTAGVRCKNTTNNPDQDCGSHANEANSSQSLIEVHEDIQADAPLGYGVDGALPPDRHLVSWWRTNDWANSHSTDVLLSPVRFQDGRHGAIVYSDDDESPRQDPTDLSSGIGTIAIGGGYWGNITDTAEGGGRVAKQPSARR